MTTPLRAARWSRVSSQRQSDEEREGLPYQRDLQDEGLASLNATDTGLEWVVTHSGGSVHLTRQWAEMIASAGRDFDVLLVAYQSRLSRLAESQLAAARLVHGAGASIYFCEEERHTASETSWEAFANEAVAAEAYRRKLSRTMRRTYRSRWLRRGLPAGPTPYGYDAGWVPNEAEAGVVKAIFTDYASGLFSLNELAARHGLAEEHVKVIIRNPAYAARAQLNGEERPASFPAIVDPDLWDTVAAMRISRRWAGGPREHQQPSMLQRRLFCQCGAPTRLDGRDGQGEHRVRHLDPCETWGPHERRRTAYYEVPIKEAFSSIRFTDEAIEQIIANRPATHAPTSSPRFDRQRRNVADRLIAGSISAAQAQGELDDITDYEREWTDDQTRYRQHQISDDTSRAFLREFWTRLDEARGQPYENELWANITSRYIARIEHRGEGHIGLVPTSDGLQAMVPATFPAHIRVGEVGGEGLEPPTFSV